MRRHHRTILAASLLLALAASPSRAGDDAATDDNLYRTLARWACATYVTFEGLLAGTSMAMCWVTSTDFQPSP